MADTPSRQAERHCAGCGALLYEGAAWCGMCFEPVATEAGPGGAEPDTAGMLAHAGPEEGGAPAVSRAMPATWPCPVCESKNAIDLDLCGTCGASFAALMRQETTRERVDPRRAFTRSLFVPGWGHRMIAGREVDGFARSVLFGMLLIATLMLGFSGVRSGAVIILFLIYLAATLAVYLITAFEARRLAEGGEPLVPSRTLLWATVGILLLSVVMVSVVIGTTAKR